IRAAIGYAARAAAMSPLDENHQALLIRLYRIAGDAAVAARQHAVCTGVLAAQLGVSPGPAVQAALREPLYPRDPAADGATIAALVEAGAAAVAAGAVEAGGGSPRTAAGPADRARAPRLRGRARLALAEAP